MLINISKKRIFNFVLLKKTKMIPRFGHFHNILIFNICLNRKTIENKHD